MTWYLLIFYLEVKIEDYLEGCFAQGEEILHSIHCDHTILLFLYKHFALEGPLYNDLFLFLFFLENKVDLYSTNQYFIAEKAL